MHTSLSNLPSQLKHWTRVSAVALTLLVVACGPSDVGNAKLKAMPDGANRTAVIAAMGTGPLTPTNPSEEPRIVSGFRRQMYIVGGQSYEILWYRDEPGTLADPIVKERETPVVVQGDTLIGWGWKFFSPFAATINLPDPSHDQARVDSIVKSQLPPDKKD